MSSRSESQVKSRSRLGRGLSSLLSLSDTVVEAELNKKNIALPESKQTVADPNMDEVATPEAPNPPISSVLDLPTHRVSANPHQPRREFDDLAELAASLKSTGVIQPIIVKKIGDDYQLIAGERRLRAARMAGLATIPAIVRDADSFAQAQMALVENIQRRDLNPLDRAIAYRALLEQLGLTQAELAARLGEERSSIANFLRLLELAEPVRQLLGSEKISLGHAKLLAGISDPAEQIRLAELVVAQELSVRNLERLLATPTETPQTRSPRSASAHVQDLERSLSRQLGLRVQLHSGKGGKGRITIHYGSLDQFDGLAERLGVALE